ncbi:MAG: bifunctional demethylmenaquinone methyltransferase/2-methoxy-6-polyprenyl-1,4-benzoquinol methylase UbiE [Pyrinomonadaceae bacterium]|nr:bifunctional demethylmenaquinone methyltransferase/2-methoxy-6-polyprenyl-1,4-benzoquinol methylase UbiE [Pyrinomonadaceae bacterium]
MQDERTAAELEHARKVREMFSRISPKYDFLNHFLSINIDKGWRAKVKANLRQILDDPKASVLDVACGTGDLSLELKNGSRAAVYGTDFCRPMLSIAAEKTSNGKIPYIESDAMQLPFCDASFDAVTIAFGLRNLSNWNDGLRELKRILKPSGKLVVLEFSEPIVPGFRQVFDFYFRNILPRIGGAFSGETGAYQYLSDSVQKFPDQKKLKQMMSDAGFSNVEYTNLTGGIAAIHIGINPV